MGKINSTKFLQFLLLSLGLEIKLVVPFETNREELIISRLFFNIAEIVQCVFRTLTLVFRLHPKKAKSITETEFVIYFSHLIYSALDNLIVYFNVKVLKLNTDKYINFRIKCNDKMYHNKLSFF